MLTGLGGKIMTYDGENRPLSVTWAGKRTCYVYGADGKRLKKVEGLPPTQDCTALPANTNATVYFGAVEVRNWLVAGQEQVLAYPHPSVKLVNGTVPGVATYLHRDGLLSVRAITSAGGVKIEAALYKPFGEQSEWVLPGNLSPETKGWIGERYDADAGLQYLNARYYDPELGLFLQPDWFEVTKAGVGTNRFSYSFNDPVNRIDPRGNSWLDRTWDSVFGSGSFNKTFGDKGSSWSDRNFGNSYEKSYSKFHSATKREAGYSKSGYPDEKQQFFENTKNSSGNGQAASGDAIFDIIGGAGFVKSIVQLGFKGTRALLGASATKTLSIRTVGELGEAAVRAAHDIGPKELVKMFGRNRFPDGILPGVLSEVKNVAKLSYTRQLRDYAAYAAATEIEFHLYVRPATELAGTLIKAIENNSIILRIIPK